MKEQQINLQAALNTENNSHMQLLSWLDDQTKNRSSFIRETLFMRMWGIVGGNIIQRQNENTNLTDNSDADEILRLIQV